jgi:hypothetical protein
MMWPRLLLGLCVSWETWGSGRIGCALRVVDLTAGWLARADFAGLGRNDGD